MNRVAAFEGRNLWLLIGGAGGLVVAILLLPPSLNWLRPWLTVIAIAPRMVSTARLRGI